MTPVSCGGCSSKNGKMRNFAREEVIEKVRGGEGVRHQGEGGLMGADLINVVSFQGYCSQRLRVTKGMLYWGRVLSSR